MKVTPAFLRQFHRRFSSLSTIVIGAASALGQSATATTGTWSGDSAGSAVGVVVGELHAERAGGAGRNLELTMGPNGMHMDRTNTWWNESSAWIGYLERCQSLLQQGTAVGQVVILTPEYEPSQMSVVQGLDQLAKRELPQGIDYSYCSQNGLLQKARLENGLIRFPLGEGYRLVVLPDTKISSLEVLTRIRELLEGGITVYAPQRPDRAFGFRDSAKRNREIQKLVADIWGEVDGKQVTRRKVGKGLLDALIPSGLLGPVTLRTMTEIPINH